MADRREQVPRHPVSKRRARASVLWTPVAFLLLQVGLGALCRSGVVIPRDLTSFTYRAIRLGDRLQALAEPPFLAVMFGSSRTRNGVQAGVIEQRLASWVEHKPLAFNFGVAGGGHIYSYYSLHRMLAEGIRPNLAVFEVFPPFLAGQAITELQWFGNRDWSAQVDDDEGLRIDVGDFSNRWWETWLVPSYSYRFHLLNVIAPKILPGHLRGNDLSNADEFGWVANEAPPQTQRSIEHVRRQFASHFDGFRLGGPSAKALRRAVDLCDQNGIRVALVLLPEASQMRTWYSPDMTSQVDHFLHRLHEETSVPIVDARDWVADEDFSDANHLRVSGATAFTQRFAREALPRILDSRREEVRTTRTRTLRPRFARLSILSPRVSPSDVRGISFISPSPCASGISEGRMNGM